MKKLILLLCVCLTACAGVQTATEISYNPETKLKTSTCHASGLVILMDTKGLDARICHGSISTDSVIVNDTTSKLIDKIPSQMIVP